MATPYDPAHPLILYVEDEPDDAFFMRNAFRKAGIKLPLRVIEDGETAVAYLARKPPFDSHLDNPVPALVLLDLNLPLRSGFEVLEWMRAQPKLRHIPVVIYSSSGRAEDRARATALGATDYLLKPSSGLDFVHVAEEVKVRWLLPLIQRP